MHFHFNLLATLLAIATPTVAQTTASPSLESVSGCAAVVSTTAVCTTCMTVDCVIPATVTAGCGSCPETAPTIYRSHGCEDGCDALGGCKTVYTVVTASGNVCAGTGSPSSSSSGGEPGGQTTLTGTVPVTSTEGTQQSVSTGAANRLSPFRLW